MMKRFKVFKKLCSLALILSMLVSMIPMNVFAAPTINSTEKGSLTINKYDSIYEANKPETHKPINGVEFTIYKIYDLVLNNGVITYTPVTGLETFLNGENPELIAEKSENDLKTFISNLKNKIKELNIDDNTANNINKTSVTTGTNGIDGQAVFSDLNLGYYLVDETAYPDQVVKQSNPFLVSVPMTNESGDSWEYDIVANPKNDTALTGIELTKYSNDYNTVLKDAQFDLQKKHEDGTWRNVNTGVLKTDSNGNLKVDGLTQGTYRFVETQAPDKHILDKTKTYEFEVKWDGDKLVYVYKGNTSDSLDIKVLNEKPIVNKTVDEPDFNIGDTVNWKITTTVPSIINNLETFELIDTLSDGLDFAAKLNLVVKQDKTSLKEGTHYTVAKDGRKLTITFDTSKLAPSKDIVVTYDTTLNVDAVIGQPGNPNHVELNYSSSTETDSTPITTKPERDPKVYTFGLKLLKVNNENLALEGAVFNLYKGDGTTLDQTTLIKGNLETDEDGKITVSGLDAGDYVLVETKAPKDYNLLKEPVKFTITAGYNENGELIPAEYKDGVLVQGPNKTNTVDGYYELTVVNKKGFQLPETGGMGTVIFTVAGLGMMGLAGAAYIALKRKESQQ